MIIYYYVTFYVAIRSIYRYGAAVYNNNPIDCKHGSGRYQSLIDDCCHLVCDRCEFCKPQAPSYRVVEAVRIPFPSCGAVGLQQFPHITSQSSLPRLMRARQI